jgi:hypothetical protein
MPRSRTPVIRWGDHRVEQRGFDAVSSMLVTGAGVDPSWRLELRLHDADASRIDQTASPFLGIAAFHGARTASGVRFGDAVTPAALTGVRDATTDLVDHFGFAPIAVEAPLTSPARYGERPRGVYFSRGVDSLSTLIHYRDRLDALIGLDWIGLPYGTPQQDETWAATTAAAAEIGLPLYRVTTNARELLDPIESWNHSHSVVLAALGVLLAGILSEAWISTAQREDLTPEDSAVRPGLLAGWSTEAVTIVRASAASGRNAKARIVAADSFASRWLKVCWEVAGEGNCGTCFKCLTTMSNFAVVGELAAVQARFRAPLTPAAVAALELTGVPYHSLLNIIELVDDLPVGALREAWASVFSRYWPDRELPAATRLRQTSR